MIPSVESYETAQETSCPIKSIQKKRIKNAVEEILDTLGMDQKINTMCGTPYRVAKMYLNEIFEDLNEDFSFILKSFENSYGYIGIVILKKFLSIETADTTCFQLSETQL